MAKNSTVTTVSSGDDALATWAQAVKASIEAAFADKKMYTQAYGNPTTFDLNNGAIQYVELAGSPSIAVSNDETGRPFTLVFKNSAGSAPTWFAGIKWAFNVTPAFSGVAGEYDVFTFIPLTAGSSYLGFAGGLGHA